MFELIFTSAPKGLFPGKSGFSTVAMTAGMPSNMVIPLENLSGYNFTYQGSELPPELNPPCCYFIKMRYGTKQLAIIGRVAPNGLDHSKRNNKIAHHVLLENLTELNYSGGAADLFLSTGEIDESSVMVKNGTFVDHFLREPCQLAARRLPAITTAPSLPAVCWQQLTGDSGTAAMIAQRFMESPKQPVYVQYSTDTNCETLLQLTREVVSLLNDSAKRNFTFSTYVSNTDANTDCFLRFIPEFSSLLSNLKRFHSHNLIELGSTIDPERLAPYENSDLMLTARMGEYPPSQLAIEAEPAVVQEPLEVYPENIQEDFQEEPTAQEPQAIKINLIRKSVNSGAEGSFNGDNFMPPPPPPPGKLRIKNNQAQIPVQTPNYYQPAARINRMEYVSHNRTVIITIISLLLLILLICGAVFTVMFIKGISQKKTDTLSEVNEPAPEVQREPDSGNSASNSSGSTAPESATPSASEIKEETENTKQTPPAVQDSKPQDANSEPQEKAEPVLPEQPKTEETAFVPMTRSVSYNACERSLEPGVFLRTKASVLPADDALELFIAVRRHLAAVANKARFNFELPLPNPLVNCVEIFVELDQLGDMKGGVLTELISNGEIIDLQEALQLKIYAVELAKNSIRRRTNSYLQMQYLEMNNVLKFQLLKSNTPGVVSPDIEDIKAIYFRVIDPSGEKIYYWPLKIQSEYAPAISKKFSKTLSLGDRLESSVKEIPELKSFIDCKLPTFTLSFSIADWNSNVEKYIALPDKWKEGYQKHQCQSELPDLEKGNALIKKASMLTVDKLKEFDAEIVKYIKSFKSSHPENKANWSVLQKNYQEIIDTLTKKFTEDDHKKQLANYQSSWHKEFENVKMFYEWQKKMDARSNDLKKQLDIKIKNVLSQSAKISPDVVNYMKWYFNPDNPRCFDDDAKENLLTIFQEVLKKMPVKVTEY